MGSIEQEKLIVEKMINLYCRKKHRTAQLCEECSLLMKYAIERLSKCPRLEMIKGSAPTALYIVINRA